MEQRPELQTVLQALFALYNPDNSSSHAEASKWLTDLQSSIHAWDIAHQLLSLDNDIKYSYFAAQTMQTKVRYYFSELPQEMHIAVRDSILNHLIRLSNGPHPIIKQLALALADLALQMTSWETVVEDCINKFGSNIATVPVLLEILIVLPEEMGNKVLLLGENQRTKWRQKFSSQCSNILQILSSCLSYWPDDEEVKTKVFACLGSWIGLKSFPVDELAQSSLIRAPFQTLHLVKVSPKLYDSATDCICSALFICDELSVFGSLASVLQTHVMDLVPLFNASIETEDVDRAYSLGRIFTEMADSFLFSIVHYPDTTHGDIKTFDLLLHCAGHYDYEIVEMTFSVWFRLSEILVKLNDKPTEERFKPYITQLIKSLVKHCQLNDDLGRYELPDDKDEFSDFRENASEVVKDTVFIIGAIECFQSLYNVMCTPGQQWVVTESCLFLMQSVAFSISREESQVLPIAIPVLLSVPADCYFIVRCTTLKLIGELAHWIGYHPDLLNEVLRFIQDGIQVPALASYAASAVQSLCNKCKGQLFHLFDSLLRIVQAADTLGMTNNAVVGLMIGSIEVLQGLPRDQVAVGIHSLCSMTTLKLKEILQQDITIQPHTPTDPAVWMDRAAAVFRSCEYQVKDGETHPGLVTATELWPLFCGIIEKHRNDQRIVERTCRCIRFILRCLRSHAGPLLTPLVTLSISVYCDTHHSCFLYLGSIIADEFGSDPNYQGGIISMLEAFLQVSLPLLSGSGLLMYPETIDDMFRLCARVVQRCPLPFLSSPVAGIALECAHASSIHMHREAFSSVMKFFKDLIHCPFDEHSTNATERQGLANAVNHILSQNGQTLISNLVKGFVTLQTYMLAESAPVLWELISNFREATLRWIEIAVNELQAEKSSKMTDFQKLKFFQSVSKADSIEDLEDSARNLARLFR